MTIISSRSLWSRLNGIEVLIRNLLEIPGEHTRYRAYTCHGDKCLWFMYSEICRLKVHTIFPIFHPILYIKPMYWVYANVYKHVIIACTLNNHWSTLEKTCKVWFDFVPTFVWCCVYKKKKKKMWKEDTTRRSRNIAVPGLCTNTPLFAEHLCV